MNNYSFLKEKDISIDQQIKFNKQYQHLSKVELDLFQKYKKDNIRLVVPDLKYFNLYLKEINNQFVDDYVLDEQLKKETELLLLNKINYLEELNNKKNQITLWLIDNNKFIGRVRLKNLEKDIYDQYFQDKNNLKEGNFGYKIATRYQNLGYGKIIMSLSFLSFSLLKKSSIFFTIDKTNIPSIKCAQALNCENGNDFIIKNHHYQIFKKEIFNIENTQ